MKVKDAFVHLRREIGSRLEAERIVAHLLNVSTSDLFQKEDEEVGDRQILAAAARRKAGEPLAYILQSQGFYKNEFIVKPGVLIPRPETEHIVEAALRIFAKGAPSSIADIGCGTGCIGLSLLKEWSRAELQAIDASATAIEVATENAKRLAVENRCTFIHSRVEDLNRLGVFDLVVANPPYISEGDERVEENVRRFEPHEALFAADNGLAAIFSWSDWACRALRENGWLLMEIGTGQFPTVRAKLCKIGFASAEIQKDLAGHERVVLARKTI